MRIPPKCARCEHGQHAGCLGADCSCFCPPQVPPPEDLAQFDRDQRRGVVAAVAKNRRVLGLSPQSPATECGTCHRYETVARIEHGVAMCVVCDAEPAEASA